MSREILFKAKGQTTGKWFKGLLTRFDQDVCCIKDKYHEEWICDSSTICQYTGLTDKNDKKIWENDIVLIHSNSIDEEDGYFTVEWYGDDAMFKMSGDGLTTDFNSFYGYECEVVGNIFNNPELLKGGTE